MKANAVKHIENYLKDYPFFALPTLSSGMARILDLSGSFNDNNITFNDDIDDFDAIYSDWKAVGKDLFYNLETFKVSKKI